MRIPLLLVSCRVKIKMPLKVMATVLLALPVMAYDNGPKVIGCDFRTNADESLKADICFIPTSGMQMGQSWIVIRPGNLDLYYRFEDNQGATSIDNERWRRAKIQRVSNYDSYTVWQGTFKYREGQCRSGGADAAIYDLNNGARFCLYYKN